MKKMRKWISFVLAAAMCISYTPMYVQAAEPATQAEDAEEVTVDLDLSVFDVQDTGKGVPEYDETTGILHAQDVEQFILKLPRQVNTDETVKVSIKGKNNGTAGFRTWLSNTNFDNLSNNEYSDVHGVGNGEDFTMEADLTSNSAATHLLIKGYAWGTNMDDVEFTSVSITYSGDSITSGPKNPYAPTKEQAYDTEDLTLTESFRNQNKTSSESVNSMLVAQRFIADPTTIEYEGRLYVYGTTDEAEFDEYGNVVSNEYHTHTLSCISTEDMVNWKDEGKIDVTELTDYAQNSWAPSIVSKEMDGKTKFFIYYTTGGDGIGVLEADSPTGPWSDPLGKRIIDRNTPTCSAEEVPWLFDPGVFVDDDGSAYIYFGGNNSGGPAGRVCKLKDDMISLDTDTMHTLEPHYYFEDNEINKIGDTYYYSYSTNWSSDLNKDETTGMACIAYYTADNPYMENWDYHGTVFANPGSLYGHTYNNHHHMFTFKGENYISYHTTYLERALYGTMMGYRNLHIDKLDVAADGTLSATATYAGVGGTAHLDGTVRTSANVMSDNAGLTTTYSESKKDMVLTEIHTGDWNKVSGVDFGTDASEIEIEVASETTEGSIEVYIDGKPGDNGAVKIATIPLSNTSGTDTYETLKADLSQKVSEIHDVYFVYRGSGYQVAAWQFIGGMPPIAPAPGTPTPAPGTATTPAPGTTTTPAPGTTATPAPGTTVTPAPTVSPEPTSGTDKVTVKKAAIKKVKNQKGKKAKVTLKKLAGVTGYQLSYATDQKFKKAKTKQTTKTSVVLKKLKKKTYYIRVRAYKTVDGQKVYGKWSSAKKIKIKK